MENLEGFAPGCRLRAIGLREATYEESSAAITGAFGDTRISGDIDTVSAHPNFLLGREMPAPSK